MSDQTFSEFPYEVIAARLESFRQECLAEDSHQGRAWHFTDGPRSPAQVGSRVFEVPGQSPRIHIIDQYHGRTPTLINRTTLTRGPNVQIGLKQYLLFDSNAVAYLDEFFSGRGDETRRTVVGCFLKYAISGSFEFSAVFYLIESLVRADPDRWLPYAKQLMSTVYSLQTVDRQLFLQTGVLASSLQARADVLAVHGVAAADDLIQRYISAIGRETALKEADAVDVSYAALLKIGLLGASRQPVEAKIDAFADFLVNRLGTVLGLERFLAMLHWSAPERYARLIPPLGRGTNVNTFAKKVRATAWDLRLARLPEQFGRFIPKAEPNAEAVCGLYYVVTAEDRLAELMQQRTVELLIQQPDPNRSIIVAGNHSALLQEVLGPEVVSALSHKTAQWERDLMTMKDRRPPIVGSELRKLITELETEVARISGGLLRSNPAIQADAKGSRG